MKKKTKLFSLLGLTLLFSVGLIGCGSKKPEENPGGGGENPPAVETQINVTAAEGKTELLIGETVQLSADVEGVQWDAIDESVAEVSNAGLVTAKGLGETKVRAKKDGYKTGSVMITVVRAPEKAAKYSIDMEIAEHYSPTGIWGMDLSMYGMGFMGPGDSPIEDNGGATEDGHSLGWLQAGCKETLKFTSNKAAKVNIGLRAAYNAEMVLAEHITAKFNDVAMNLAGVVLDGAEDGSSYYEWHNVDFGEVTLNAGENIFEVEMIAQGPNIDLFLVFTNEELTIAGIPAPVKEKIVVANSEVTLVVDETAQIESETTGLTYVSANPEVATVSETGLITGISAGTTQITVSKEGMKDATVSVRVKAKPVAGQVLLEAEEGVIDGARVENDSTASGGARVGYLSEGTSLQLSYTATEAKTVKVTMVAASNAVEDWSTYPNVTANDLDLNSCMTAKYNGEAISLEGKVVEGGAWGTWRNVELGEFELKVGENVFLFEMTAQGPNIDCLILGEDGGGTPDPEEKIIKTEPVDLTDAFYLEAEEGELAGGAKVEDNAGAHGGKAVGYMAKDASITIKFNASKAGKAHLVLLGGSANADWSKWPDVTYFDQELESTTSIKVNGADVSLTKKGFLGADGNAMVQVDLGEIDVALENTLVVTALAQSANFDAFALLADGITFELVVPEVPAFAITSAQIANENDKPVITLSGTSEFATAEMFVADVQSYSTWKSYTYAAPVTLDEAGNWTLKFDISLAKDSEENSVPAGQYLIRLFFNGADAVNLLPYEGFAPVEEFVIDNAGYSIAAVDTWWNVKTVMLSVTDKAAPAKTVTSVKVEVRDNKAYFVIEGTCQNVTADMFTMDFQRYNNGWAKTAVTPTVSIKDGTFHVEVELSALELVVGGQYIVHFKLASESGDGNLASYTGFAATNATLGETQYSTVEMNPWGSALIFLQLDAVA